jgi:hypothetical protein
MVTYKEYAHGTELKRIVGLGRLANLDATIEHMELADIGGLVDCHTPDDAPYMRSTERQVQLRRLRVPTWKHGRVADNRILFLAFAHAPRG